MFFHEVCELDVFRLLSVGVKVVAAFVYVHGDPMFSRLIAFMDVAHESRRVGADDVG